MVAAQINPLVGAVNANAEKIIKYALQARDELYADIVVFPEMALTGYPPEDLLLRTDLYKKVQSALNLIKRQVKNIHVIVGFPEKVATANYNSAAIIYNGKILAKYHKQELPNYGVFDEKRYFVPGDKITTFSIKKTKIALAICEDLWFPKVMQEAKKAHAKLLLSINASPFDIDKSSLREQTLKNVPVKATCQLFM